jgi:hypothetical protein
VKKLLAVTALAVFGIGLSARNKESQEDYVVAKIGGEKITEAVLNEKLSAAFLEYQNYVNTALGRKQLDRDIKKYY